MMDNCLTYALRTWRFGRASDHLVIRKSHWGWFPHFAVIFELFFRGLEKTTVYRREEIIDARQGN